MSIQTTELEREVEILPPDKIQMIDNPRYLGVELSDRNNLYTIAVRLQRQTKDTITGKKGFQGTGSKFDKGTLTLDESLYVVQWCMLRGLNPFTDIHIWYYEKLQVTEHYKIIAGWAQLRAPYTAHFLDLSEEDRRRYFVQEEDVAVFCCILKDRDKPRFDKIYKDVLSALVQAGNFDVSITDVAARAAHQAVSTFGVGLVKAQEMQKKGLTVEIPVKGWSWKTRAETRAQRQALSRSHGAPTIVEVQQYALQINPGLTPAALASGDYDTSLPTDLQKAYFALSAQTEETKKLAKEDPDALKERSRNNVDLMRGDSFDFDPTAEG